MVHLPRCFARFSLRSTQHSVCHPRNNQEVPCQTDYPPIGYGRHHPRIVFKKDSRSRSTGTQPLRAWQSVLPIPPPDSSRTQLALQLAENRRTGHRTPLRRNGQTCRSCHVGRLPTCTVHRQQLHTIQPFSPTSASSCRLHRPQAFCKIGGTRWLDIEETCRQS